MATELEITKRDFYTTYHSYASKNSSSIEDSKFIIFTDFLDEIDIINTPILARSENTYKQRNWSILGYSCNSYLSESINDDEEIIENEEEEEEEELEKDKNNHEIDFDYNWEYALINGFFSEDSIEIYKAKKSEIDAVIKETICFVDKTFAESLINDICETRSLQEQIIEINNKKKLDRIDIHIITDTIIEQDNLENSIYIKSIDKNCRIYYWDLKKWSELKRSKSKRIPINIDFNSRDYNIYNIKYIEEKISNSLSYYLTIFPGSLISEIYDINRTRILENNVRVFLSTSKKTNKEIRKTIKENPSDFFSFNNGISATAESVKIENGKIVEISDFQIVNGGQTTATIHYTHKIDKTDIDKVNVAVKITAIKKNENYGKIVSQISAAANSQTAISKSDFISNDPFLIEIERLSLKNPIFSQDGKNIYYFFERMKGQYNVTKSSKGTKRQQEIWEINHPNKLMFNKIDIARWSNIMLELPDVASTGAEKQFEDFRKEKSNNKDILTIGKYKNLIGLGLLFKRAYLLCGKANNKTYPSIILDPNTGKHSPVALSTAIYSMAYLHYITEGRFDYLSVYNDKYQINNSLINNKTRYDLKIDNILLELINECWIHIAKFGGAAAQEKSKKKECWSYVKKNISLNQDFNKRLDLFLITKEEKEKRNSNEDFNEDSNYFISLDTLLNNNAQVFQLIGQICSIETRFFKEKNLINNQIKRVKSKNDILAKRKIIDCISIYEKLKNEGFSFKDTINRSNEIIINFSTIQIYNVIFKNKQEFLIKYENYVLENESEFDLRTKNYELVKDILEKYIRENGLSVEDFEFLNERIKEIDID